MIALGHSMKCWGIKRRKYRLDAIDNTAIGVLPKWISVKKRMPNCEKVLAIFVPEKNAIYNMNHEGWFENTIYACWMKDKKFIIESHGPSFPATHWMPLPSPPEEP